MKKKNGIRTPKPKGLRTVVSFLQEVTAGVKSANQQTIQNLNKNNPNMAAKRN